MNYLADLGLQDYMPMFDREHIDMDSVMLLSDSDMKLLGLPLGPRRTLANSLASRAGLSGDVANQSTRL